MAETIAENIKQAHIHELSPLPNGFDKSNDSEYTFPFDSNTSITTGDNKFGTYSTTMAQLKHHILAEITKNGGPNYKKLSLATIDITDSITLPEPTETRVSEVIADSYENGYENKAISDTWLGYFWKYQKEHANDITDRWTYKKGVTITHDADSSSDVILRNDSVLRGTAPTVNTKVASMAFTDKNNASLLSHDVTVGTDNSIIYSNILYQNVASTATPHTLMNVKLSSSGNSIINIGDTKTTDININGKTASISGDVAVSGKSTFSSGIISTDDISISNGDTAHSILFKKDNKVLGRVVSDDSKENKTITSLQVYDTTSNFKDQIAIIYASDNTVYTYAPQPIDITSTTSNQIATVGWINNNNLATNIVHKTGGEIISGAKTFTNTITSKNISPSYISHNTNYIYGTVADQDKYLMKQHSLCNNSDGTSKVMFESIDYIKGGTRKPGYIKRIYSPTNGSQSYDMIFAAVDVSSSGVDSPYVSIRNANSMDNVAANATDNRFVTAKWVNSKVETINTDIGNINTNIGTINSSISTINTTINNLIRISVVDSLPGSPDANTLYFVKG